MRTISFLFLLSFGFFTSCQEAKGVTKELKILPQTPEKVNYFALRSNRFNAEKQKAKSFLITHSEYNQELVFLIDMKIPSAKFRIFLYNLKSDSIVKKGLIAHGSGSVYSSDSLVFSNTPNSYQTSLGSYKIGNSYSGNFGKSYKLHGLDKTNDKAYQRLVVFHPYTCVPDEEQDYFICESLGCPMVSNQFMTSLYSIIDGSKKAILMVIYY
jgi:hypothetical protein